MLPSVTSCLPITLILTVSSFILSSTPVLADDVFGEECSTSNNRLQVGTYQFASDCDTTTYCASNGTCAHRGCRKDVFPFGYSDSNDYPPLCESNQFCPDEGDACQDLLAVGSDCQLNRDDECAPPDDWRELADSKYGLNVNGSVCLNNKCMWANVTVGLKCVVENTAYIVYGTGNQESINIVSRGNCKKGLYCDSQNLVCIEQKDVGENCDADKECKSFNCLSTLVCGDEIDAAAHVGVWVYVIVAICIFGGMIGTLVGLFFLHSKQREREREKRLAYWREQNAFRQNILQMRDTAHASMLSLPNGANTNGSNSARSTLYSQTGLASEDSNMPILQNSGGRGSNLRHQNYAESEASDIDTGNYVRERETDGMRYRSAQAF